MATTVATTKDDFEHILQGLLPFALVGAGGHSQPAPLPSGFVEPFSLGCSRTAATISSASSLDFLKKLVVGDYHPAVKINAMLAIGELNRVEQSGRDAAVPLPEALDV